MNRQANESDDDDRTTAALVEYYRACAREDVDRQDFAARHPAVAAGLQAHWRLADELRQLAAIACGSDSEPPDTQMIVVAPGTRSLPAQTIGSYCLEAEIGRGGMGVVYRARQPGLDRTVAVKVILAGALAGDAEIRRFHAGAAAAARLRHEGIAAVYEVSQRDGQHFLAMEWIDGTNLKELLQQRGPFPPREAAQLVRDVARAVDHAHAAGVIHRDLKPSNILIDRRGRPRVTDFGLARIVDAASGLTLTGEAIGTPNFMPPEQAGGQHAQIGPGSDVYSLGATPYALLTGRPPLEGVNVLETLWRVRNQSPPAPRLLRPEIPRDLETIVLKCLDKEVGARYESAAAFADDLERFLADRPIAARRTGRVERSWRWFRRNPVLGAFAVAAAASLIAGTVVSAYFAVSATRGEQRALGNLYAADMSLAQQQVTAGWTDRALALLEKHRPVPGAVDGRGWEWQYTWQQCHGELRLFEGFGGAAHRAIFSPDGALVAAATDEHTVCLWQAATGKLLRKLRGHSASVYDEAFRPDGKCLVSVGSDRKAVVWQVSDGQVLGALVGHEKGITSVAWSPDGRFIATGGLDDAQVRLWDGQTFKLLRVLELGPVRQLAFAPKLPLLAAAGRNGAVRVCDIASGTTVADWQQHAEEVNCVAFSPDGKQLATGGGGCAITIWDARTWAPLTTYSKLPSTVVSLCYSPDGGQLACGSSDQLIRVYDATGAGEVVVLRGHTWRVDSVSFSPTGWRLVSASDDGTVRLWDPRQPTEYRKLARHQGKATAVAFSPDSQLVASAGAYPEDGIVLYDVRAGGPQRTLRSNSVVMDIDFSPDGSRLASAELNGRLRVWNVESGQEEAVFEGAYGPILSARFLPDGGRIVCATEAGPVVVFSFPKGVEVARLSGHEKGSTCLAVSPRGDLIASGGHDQKVRLWTLATKSLVRQLNGHEGPIARLAFNHDGTLLASASVDQTVRLWDVASGQQLRVFTHHGGRVLGVAFSPDGQRMATSSADRSIKIWDPATGHELYSLGGDIDWQRGVAFSPDGFMLASAGGDGFVRLWDARQPDAAWSAQHEAGALLFNLALRIEGFAPTLSAIRGDRTISEAVRSAALQQAGRFPSHYPWLLRGHDAAQRGRWAEAAGAFDRATRRDPSDAMHWHWLALTSFASGNIEQYAAACEQLLKRFSDRPTELQAWPCLWSWLISPRTEHDLERLEPLVNGLATTNDPVIGMYWLRRGRLEHLGPRSQWPTAFMETAEQRYVLAWAYLAAGDRTSARLQLQAAGAVARTTGEDWPRTCRCGILSRELWALLGKPGQ